MRNGICFTLALALCLLPASGGAAPALREATVPEDPENFPRVFGAERVELLEKLNRADRSRLRTFEWLVAPVDWGLGELELSPLPARLEWAAGRGKIVVVDVPLQAFGAYGGGRLVRWGPVSTGGPRTPTPPGLYHLNWRSQGRHSTVNAEWFLRWYYNFHNRTGWSFHEYELPGVPASHGCVRLLSRDAQWLYGWGESWRLGPRGWTVLELGTPVFVIGRYDFDQPPPWRQPELLSNPAWRSAREASLTEAAIELAGSPGDSAGDGAPTVEPFALEISGGG